MMVTDQHQLLCPLTPQHPQCPHPPHHHWRPQCTTPHLFSCCSVLVFLTLTSATATATFINHVYHFPVTMPPLLSPSVSKCCSYLYTLHCKKKQNVKLRNRQAKFDSAHIVHRSTQKVHAEIDVSHCKLSPGHSRLATGWILISPVSTSVPLSSEKGKVFRNWPQKASTTPGEYVGYISLIQSLNSQNPLYTAYRWLLKEL